MKIKYLILLLFLISIVSKSNAQTTATTKKILVTYFSHSGNTKAVAFNICKKTNAEIFEIKTTKPYPEDYHAVVEIAKKELQSDYRPTLVNNIKDIRQYDIIFIGYPNWWGTYPQAVKVFLSMNNLTGKTVIPFCTHEGSELGRSVSDLKKMCPQSLIGNGLAIRGSSSHNCDENINQWLKELNIIR